MKKIALFIISLSFLACTQKENNTTTQKPADSVAVIDAKNLTTEDLATSGTAKDLKDLSKEEKMQFLQGNWEILDEETRTAVILQVKDNQMATTEQLDNEYGWDTFEFVGTDALVTTNSVLKTSTKYKILALTKDIFTVQTEDGIRNEWKRSE